MPLLDALTDQPEKLYKIVPHKLYAHQIHQSDVKTELVKNLIANVILNHLVHLDKSNVQMVHALLKIVVHL